MKRVLLIQHAEVEKPGTIAEVITSAGYPIQPIRAFDGQPVPQAASDAQGLVIMGGPMGVYERDRYPFLREELHLIGNTLAEGKPILGICLGSQLVAAALGAEVKKGRFKEIGWYSVSPTEAATADALLAGIDHSFVALHWHGDVFDLPCGAVSLASSQLTECQAFRYQKNIYGFLFHIETTAEILRGMVATFADELRQEGMDGQAIMQGAGKYLPGLQRFGHAVFERWAALLGKE
jgi:GMP synthase (glutamine-hydrolysing)